MEDRLEPLYLRITSEQKAKLERMRRGSGRRTAQNVVEILIVTADESDPQWNIVPQEAPDADPIPESR